VLRAVFVVADDCLCQFKEKGFGMFPESSKLLDCERNKAMRGRQGSCRLCILSELEVFYVARSSAWYSGDCWNALSRADDSSNGDINNQVM
jgi:hypothetical protein